MTADADSPVLEITDLRVVYRGRGLRSAVPAVSGIDLEIRRGETLALVGESGSGKSTIGKAVVGLVAPARGRIQVVGEAVDVGRRHTRRALARRVQMVFQDPYSSLDPTKRVGYTLAEPLLVHERIPADEVARRVAEMLTRVGLPADSADRYPTQFSGGQRQRVAIARALMVRPPLVICDEPVSALDLSIQAQILNLLSDLQLEFGLSYLFISHDLSVVRHVAHRVAVLNRGQLVEVGATADVCGRPTHPYTQALIAAAPIADPARQRARRSRGELVRPVGQ